ncbi:hypothetical protein EV356DRAFT_509443 [Viridothelium virens]|uniref:Uncharacterized protein n=1 Tax=Viridothelium virens TaxID=1048519 RepID=A0A6A6GW75_VIRVR|nr:hypothetical protein EV356DRAFT_509443 [Viridothelium virens]
MIRIHRAEPLKRDSASFEDVGPIPTKPPYNLEFQFEEYKFFPQREFTRENVVDMFAKIMIGYGEGVLHKLLKNAAIEIDRKFKTLREKGILPLQAINDYRHGQKELPSRDTKTPRQSEQLGQGGRGTSTRSNDIARQAAEGRVSEANQAGLTRSSSGSILEGNSVPEDEPPSTGLSQRVENLETGPPAKKPRTSGGGGRGKNTGR